jgi:anti-sigma B factor antagonist
MTGPTAPRGADAPGPADEDFQARFDIVPGTGQQPATVRAAGDIDLDNAHQFQAALTEAAATAGEITVDMTAVTYCDSAAIRALLTAARHGRLTLVVPGTGPITTMLTIAGLDQITTVVTPH